MDILAAVLNRIFDNMALPANFAASPIVLKKPLSFEADSTACEAIVLDTTLLCALSTKLSTTSLKSAYFCSMLVTGLFCARATSSAADGVVIYFTLS